MFNFFSSKKDPIQFWFNTDIHAHVLPGVDDGSADVETSVELVRSLGDMGIRRIIASPHVTDDSFENDATTLDAAQASLDAALAEAGVEIPVTHAAENRIDDLLMRNFERGTLLTYPGNYVLIENSFVQEPWGIEQLVFDMQIKGYQPIFAHPERFLYYHSHPERYKELHKLVPFQVNVLSLAGYYGKNVKKVAEQLVDGGMVDFLGTDTHGERHIECFREYLRSKDALRHRAALEGRIRNDRTFG